MMIETRSRCRGVVLSLGPLQSDSGGLCKPTLNSKRLRAWGCELKQAAFRFLLSAASIACRHTVQQQRFPRAP